MDEQIVRCCPGYNRCCLPGEAHLKRVKELGVHNIVTACDQSVTKTSGLLGDALGDCLQAIRPVINGKHASHHGEEHLSGADVAGRLVAADVLFSGLQSQAVRGVAIGVLGDADQATRHLTLETISNREVTSVGASKAERNTKALRCSHRNVSAEFAGRGDESESQQISGNHSEATVGVRLRDGLSGVDNPARSAGVLNKHTKTFRQRGGEVALDEFDTEWFSATSHDGLGLRERISVNHEHGAFLTRDTTSQQHGLSNSCGLVEHGRVSGCHSRQVSNHGLEVQEGFEASLRDFWLVGGVGRIPTGVLEHVALDHARGVGSVVAKANQ